MQRLFSALFLVALSSGAAWAGLEEEDEVSFHAGRTFLSLKSLASATGSSSLSGYAYGLRYLHSATPVVAFGLDVDFLKPQKKTSSALIEGGTTTAEVESTAVFAIARLGPTEGDLRPRGLLGFGAHVSSLKLDAEPQPGFVWRDTGTTEHRRLVDGDGIGPAIKLEGGADYAFTDNWLAGGSLSFDYIGNATYRAADGAQRLGIDTVRGSMTAITLAVNVTARF